MSKKKLVLVGNGMAGVRTIEEIIKLAPDKYDITIFGEEPHPNYNRIQLSNVLQGKTTLQGIIMNDWDWYKENNINLLTGEEVLKIEEDKVHSKNHTVDFDELIIATGSKPFILPIPGATKEGVIGFRTIQDCKDMFETSTAYKRAVVIGGGLLGLEAARGLLDLGMDVHVVHLPSYLMEKQLDPAASTMLQKELEQQGIKFLMNKQTVEIVGNTRVEGLKFIDGTSIEADLVVMAIGIVPNSNLAKETGLYVNRGIVVNDFMETNCENIFAVGECAEHREVTYGLVAPLYEQAKVLAARITGKPTKPYEGSVTGTQLKVAGIDLFSAGEILDDPSTKSIKMHNEFDGVYKKILIRENRIVGIVLYGDTSDSTKLFRMLAKKEDISNLTSVAILSNGDGGTTTSDDISTMPSDEIVCGCTVVTKGTIVQAVKEQGVTSVEEVGGCTNAGRSCGRCKPLISNILSHTLGDQFKATSTKKSLCGCTTNSREEIVAEIKEKGLTTIKEVMYVLGWKNEEGCSKCRPALNYFLGMIFPEEYIDDRNSRLVNEKLHANIQKDGTYSVVPRMYGGVTSAQDLKKIAEVAEKYNVPLVKLTGGQRIGLFGVKKEDLTSVWKDLDMPSGYAYGKTLRTVKTCVGSQHCRFGTQDSMSLGIELEKKFERLDTPHKFKMGVSACPRNCAEAGIKDIGFVGIDGGWEIYIAGNGGTDLRAGDLLCTVKTKAEVMEITGAFLQYYRENANYLERTSNWIERVGLDHVRQLLDNKEMIQELNQRLDTSLKRYIEPWKEAVENNTVKETYYTKVQLT
ncbi:NAD(P)/FAD-dependent oxidoreductase [Bacillus luteolus]|uniref:NAD(P)/FAD-dependent oxidoreductase n=1 Tax=Litchfieldia luteola TaxID=682179 RepID=A0ABR9QQ60_9BACI|nr:nitrite reductase large subunit NirB [Cytobacillus luteolus]MBE4910626.1 NAD(P)/FAD-dependent oxidoreductase [Cytobacillus luteolus]MBP1943805.1 nitrite reductase (NADH) large subunit [Cytobacillus luteolus]